ncbi:MAG TPA: hypothetical protein P5550_10765 [Bacteroidales bacterium]|nr:hypothetical protein [Bacteroidales bacterium]HRZ78005.1 hypothetical protein [Bacteroidales bacterium]
MKKTITILFSLSLLSLSLAGQDTTNPVRRGDDIRTLFGNDISHGGYGGITMGYTQINDEDAWVVGGRAAWIINHSFALGVGGFGLMNDIPVDQYWQEEEKMSLIVGYGGILLEPIFMARQPVHLTMPILVAGGAISMAPGSYWTSEQDWDPGAYHNDIIFVFEPGLELELNLTRFMRLSGGVSYRLTSEIELPGMEDDILNGYAATFSLKFGKF